MLLLVVLIPLFFLALLISRVTRPHAVRLAPWAPLPALLLALFEPADAYAELPALLLGMHLGLDGIGRVFLLFTAVVCLAAGWYARAWFADEARAGRFGGFFLAAQAGNLGVCIAQGAVDFYVFFALMSFAAYGLVIHDGSTAARRAGRVYLALTVVGEMLILAGLMLLVAGFDSNRFADFRVGTAEPAYLVAAAWCVLLGFGVKTGLPLLHFTLPLAYAAIPVPAGAVLAGVMIKAGVLGWVRFLPLGEVAWPVFGALVMVIGLAAIFLGAVIGLTQRDPAALLGYSSISQMGYLVVALGAALVEPGLWPALALAVTLYATHHALAKSALFLGLGIVARRGMTPWVAAGLALPVLALAGAPLTSGLLAKTALKSGLAGLPEPWAAWLPVLLTLGAFTTALLMLRWLWLVRATRVRPEQAVSELLPGWVLLLCGVIAMTLLLAPTDAWRTTLRAAALADAIWPILVALALAAFAAWRGLRVPNIPPGDLLIPIETSLAALASWRDSVHAPLVTPEVPRAAVRSPWVEARLRTWPVAGMLWLVLFAVLVLSLGI